MNCEIWRGRVTDLARDCGPDADVCDHLRECSDCARFFDEQAGLTSLMKEAAQDETAGPPKEIESFLLEEFAAVRSARRPYGRLAVACGTLAAAVAGFALLRPTEPPVTVQAPAPTMSAVSSPPATASGERVAKQVVRHAHRRRAPKPDDDEAPFVPIPYTLPLDPREPVAMMRVAMPVTALVAVGLVAAAPDPSAFAQADVLVSKDGRIRALRLVSFENSDFGSERRTIP